MSQRRETLLRCVLGAVIAALALVAVVTFPGRHSDQDRRKVRAADRAAQAIVDGLLHDIAAGADLRFRSGGRRVAVCGDRSTPIGVILRLNVNLDYAGRGSGSEDAQQVLAEHGWDVDPSGPIWRASRGIFTLQYHPGAALVAISVWTECVRTNKRVANQTVEDGLSDLDWK